MRGNGEMNIACVILGGGQGERLWPLTRERAKPAVPIAGKYRLVDIPISNCIRSNLRDIYLLTQFNSVSLHEHVQDTYKFDQFHRGFVRILAAQQTQESDAWYLGTADAVRKTFNNFMDFHPELIVVLSGDQLYRMDYRKVVQQHLETNADVTICTKPVSREEAGDLGIMQVTRGMQIVNFVEKPGCVEALDPLSSPSHQGDEQFLASMGIYVFNTPVLRRLLESESSDFGRDIIPSAINDFRVYSHVFDGYWRDIGTIRSFWEANLSLAEPVPEFSFYEATSPIYTHMRFLPPSKINRCQTERCLLSEGSVVSAERISSAVIGIRSIIGEGTTIENSVIMGADYYDTNPAKSESPKMGIGRDCIIQNAIIDKNVRIGDRCIITPDDKEDETTNDFCTMRDGIVVVPKGSIVPAGTRI